jgi:glycosyltransferase involved in cell wall biosynthesis
VKDGETGLLVPFGDIDALADALVDTRIDAMRPEAAIASAQRFSVEAFGTAMRDIIEQARERGSRIR